MCIRRIGIILAMWVMTACAGVETGSVLGIAERPAQAGAITQLTADTGSKPRLDSACYRLPRGKVSLGPAAKHCVSTPNGFMCMPECSRRR
jgi:hypothetical protein